MHFEDLQLLEAMTTIPSVSGHEDRFMAFLAETIAPWQYKTTLDGVGNLIAYVPGADSGRRLMIFAHGDELGLCVKHITDDGYLKVDRIGGINRKCLSGCPVIIHTEDGRAIPGSVGVVSHHQMQAGDYLKIPDIPELYVDIGAGSYEEALAMGVKVGNPITFQNTFAKVGPRCVRARGLDNKAGCWILLKVLQALAGQTPPVDVYIVFSVQEEFNVRGVLPAARKINPSAAICVDGAFTGDTPDLAGRSRNSLGCGPVATLMNFHGRGTLGGLIPNPKLLSLVEKAAAKADLPLSRQAGIGGLTDTSFLQLLQEGIPCLDLGYPKRYSHSPIEMLDMSDLYSMVSLLLAVIAEFESSTDFSRGR